MKKRDKRKRAKRHQKSKDQQIVEEIIETEKLKLKLKSDVAEMEKHLLMYDLRNYPDSFDVSLTKWAWLQGGGGGAKTGSEN